MAITRPGTLTIISTASWGNPITDEVNRLTTWQTAQLPTAWATPTFSNGWVGLTTGGVQPTQYRKIGDLVYVRGAMVGGTFGNTAITLPVGFRPPAMLYFMEIIAGGTLGYISIAATGIIVPYGSSNSQVGTEAVFSITP
jgi:hypothetical protein